MKIKLMRLLLVAVTATCLVACGGKGKKDGDAGSDADDDGTVDAGDDVDEDAEEDAVEDVPTDVETDSEDPCPHGEAWNPYSTPPGCVPCARECTFEGETGEHWPITARSGDCVCTTEDGYYFSLSGAGVSHACDEDGDGWVNISARPNIESSDEAIADNARCHLREVDTFVLLAEGEDPATDGCAILLADTDLGVSSLELYEADERDDQALLDGDTYAPAYGGRKMRAEELNSLTKGCMNAIGDFNANGVADVNDWDLGGDALHAFSYFLELHRGWYEDGSYYVQEKSRLSDAPAGWGTPLTYNDDGYWRECVRMTDSAFVPTNAIGMDFARYNDSTHDAGMLHHSQFKCIQIVETNDDPVAFPQKMPLSELEVVPRRYVLNSCSAGDETAPPVTGTVNPSDAVLTCGLDTTPALDEVGFVSVKYIHYDDTTSFYERGCVNGCIDDPPTCPTHSSCEPDTNDYGRPECVCHGGWRGTACDECPAHWDPSDCLSCEAYYDESTDCLDCLPGWDITTGCTACLPNYDPDPTLYCTRCLGNYDIATNCVDCINHFDETTGCTACDPHWDLFTMCATCTNNWDLSATPPCESCVLDSTGTYELFTRSSDCLSSGNMLSNPGAESGLADWTVSVGTASAATSGYYSGQTPHGGSRLFECHHIGSWPLSWQCKIIQDVDISEYASWIDAGTLSVALSGYQVGYWGTAGILVYYRSATGSGLGNSPQPTTTGNSWTYSSTTGAITSGTRTLRFMMDSDPSGDYTDNQWDDLFMGVTD
jgi:hypothetical protein